MKKIQTWAQQLTTLAVLLGPVISDTHMRPLTLACDFNGIGVTPSADLCGHTHAFTDIYTKIKINLIKGNPAIKK